MNTETAARQAARERVSDELTRRGVSPAELARRADVDSDTVNDFLNGRRWPQAGTRAKIARALDWAAEAIDMLVRGQDPFTTETVGEPIQDDAVLASLPAEALQGLDAAERAEVIAAAKLSALQTAREIRRRLDS